MIYFDHSATTPTDEKALKAMKPYFSNSFGNPSSIHSFGAKAVLGVDKAREQAASFLGADTDEIIFTSGATEANNLTLRGIVKAAQKEGIKKPHIITTRIEHDSILEPASDLEEEGIKITYLPVNKEGIVRLGDARRAIEKNTVLVSIMYVNSETGSVQPVKEIGKIIKKINERRLKEWQKRAGHKVASPPRRIYFHTDATQAVNFFDCNVKKLNVDLLSLSGHKIYGPKGVGALFVENGTKIKGVQLGGHHEKNLRSGTLNVPGIVGLGKALSLITKSSQERNNKKIARLRDMLVRGIMENISDVVLNTPRENATSAHAHFTFLGCEGESILISLDLAGIAVSTGSACASESLEPSHVLVAMGIAEDRTHCSIRFTLGKNNTQEEIKRVVKVLPGIIKKFRKMNPIYKKKR